MKLATFTASAVSALFLAQCAIRESAWVEITPMPDDVYEVTVKDEHRVRIRKALEETNLNAMESARKASQPRAPLWQLRRRPRLAEDANPVPPGVKPRPGIKYGCGKVTCQDCYEPDPEPQQESQS